MTFDVPEHAASCATDLACKPRHPYRTATDPLLLGLCATTCPRLHGSTVKAAQTVSSD
jgi:hypothetical protein